MNREVHPPRCEGSRNHGTRLPGKSAETWWKHEQLGKLLRAQAAVFALRPGRGIVIDMHAGDGRGVPHPQRLLFMDGHCRSVPTPMLCIQAARSTGASVLLCERKRASRERLTRAIEASATELHALVFGDNHGILDLDLRSYTWAIVVHDPNGWRPDDLSLDVLDHIVRWIPRSDLVFAFNEKAAARAFGRFADGESTGGNPLVVDVRETARSLRWLMDGNRVAIPRWLERFRKRYAVVGRMASSSGNYRGRAFLLTNYPATFNSRYFEVLECPTLCR